MKKFFTASIDFKSKENDKWSYFEERVKLIYAKIRSDVKINNFLNILNESILLQDANNVNLSS